MTIPKINSAHGSDTRNIINAAIDSINFHGKTIQDLVAEGQLTEEQYAKLIRVVNQNVKRGEVDALLGKISDGTPLFSDDIEGMTDTTRLYVNTSDGFLYAHDGTMWESTGVQYQGTGIADEFQLEVMKKIGLTPIENKVKNGDFAKDSDGDGLADGWSKAWGSETSHRISNGAQYWTGSSTSASGSLSTENYLPNKPGHKYYFYFEGKNVGTVIYHGSDAATSLKYDYDDLNGSFSRIREMDSSYAPGEFDKLRFHPELADVESHIKKVIFIDLTESFGVGSEPTLETMDTFIDEVGHFNRFTTDFNASEVAKKVDEIENLQKENETILAEVKDDVDSGVIRMENIVENGDFRNGTAGWYPGEGSREFTSLEVINGVLSITIDELSFNYSSAVKRGAIFKEGHKYFIKVDSKSPLPYRLTVGQSRSLAPGVQSSLLDSDQWNEFSTIYKPSGISSSHDSNFSVGITGAENFGFVAGNKFELKDILVVDLTDIFGLGNEPSHEKMNGILNQVPGRFFDGKEKTNSVLTYLINQESSGGGSAGATYDKEYRERIAELTQEVSILTNNTSHAIDEKSDEPSSIQTIPLKKDERQKMILHLHKRENDGYNTDNDVYLPHAKDDFKDVRIKTDTGEHLSHHVIYKGDVDIIQDSRLGEVHQGEVFSDSHGDMYVDQNYRIAKSTDNGKTWNVIPEFDIGENHRLLRITQDDIMLFSTNSIVYRSAPPYTEFEQVLDISENYTQLSLISDRLTEHPDGEIFLGAYQYERIIRIYRSSDGGATWEQVVDWPETYQHVHAMYTDVYSDPITIYAGVDGGGGILKSTDKGETWTDIRSDTSLDIPQSTDKGVTYASSKGYKLFGGETAIVGGYSIIKTKDDINYYPVLGVGNSTMKIKELNGKLIASVNASASSSKSYRNTGIYISEDEGESWVQARTTQPLDSVAANAGYRFMAEKAVYSSTDYEQIIAGSNVAEAPPLRIISDGNSNYAEVVVDVPEGVTSLTVESGYIVSTETKISNDHDVLNAKLASFDLNDGGNYIKENLSGEVISGEFEYHDVGKHMSVHYPYVTNIKDKKSLKLTSLKNGLDIDIDLASLNAFTISFWSRMDYGVNADIISNTNGEYLRLVNSYQLHDTNGSIGTLLRWPTVPDAFNKYDIIFDKSTGTISTYENGFNVRVSNDDMTALITNLTQDSEVKLFKVIDAGENDAIQHLAIYEGALSEDDIYHSYHDRISDNQH